MAIALLVSLLGSGNASAQKELAPGVLKVVPPKLNVRDSYSLPMELPGVQATPFDGNFIARKQTLHGQTRAIVFFRDIWQYEFAFTGLRQIRLNVRQSDGSMQSKNFWYLVYRLRDTGANLTYEQVKDDPRFEHMKYELRPNAGVRPKPNEFLPRFSLEGWVKDDDGGYHRVVNRDQLLPDAAKQIQFLEDPGRPLLDTLQMMKATVPVAKSPADPGIWGIAVWTDVDPKIDYLSVYVNGITNAYRLARQPSGEIAVRKKTLQLNFWRPGDSVQEDRDQVDFGIPLVDDPKEQIEITKRYQLPGPVIRGYLKSEKANQNVLLVELDAEVNLKDFQSALTPELDQGKLPEKIATAFADAGVSIPEGTAIVTDIRGSKWTFTLDSGGDQPETYILRLQPQFWERSFEGIRFIKSLDYLWIYR